MSLCVLAAVHQALPWSLLRFAFLGLVGVVSHKVRTLLSVPGYVHAPCSSTAPLACCMLCV